MCQPPIILHLLPHLFLQDTFSEFGEYGIFGRGPLDRSLGLVSGIRLRNARFDLAEKKGRVGSRLQADRGGDNWTSWLT